MAETTDEPATQTPPPTTSGPAHPPVPSISLPALPPEFSDIGSAVACWDSHISYTVSSSFLALELARSEQYTSISYTSPITKSYSYDTPLETCFTDVPGLKTLCDGYPRADDCIIKCTSTGHTRWTDVFTETSTGFWVTPTWGTEIDQIPKPTCTVAKDLSPECSRLADAYSWRTAQETTEDPAAPTLYIPAPDCAVSEPPPSTKRCSLTADSYEAYYWPTPTPSDPNAFCSPNATAPTGTTTIPGRPNTAVVSGLTLTSPYVYHILHNATVLSFEGRASKIGDGPGESIYGVSSFIPKLTFAQPSNSILSQSKECHKPGHHGLARCTLSYHPDFNIQDLYTVPAKVYYGEDLPETPTTATICQASYGPTIALPISEVAAQNKVGEDCDWTFSHRGITVTLREDVYSVAWFGGGDYHPITASQAVETTARMPSPGSGTTLVSVAVPTGR